MSEQPNKTNLTAYRTMKKSELKTLHPDHKIKVCHPVLGGQLKVDIVDIAPDDTCAIYLTKTRVSVEDLGKLLLCWCGLIDQGNQPTVAYIVCKECEPMLEETCQALIKAESTDGGPHYNFQIIVDPSL